MICPLTAGLDAGAAFAGTAGNDTFIAADANNNMLVGNQNVFNIGDDIKGGAGTDTLKIYGDIALSTVQLAKIAEIENVELTSDSLGQTATDLRGLTGVKEVTVKGGGGIDVALGSSSAVIAAIDGAMAAGSAGVNIRYAQADSTADSATLKLNAAVRTAVPAAAIALDIANTVGAIETLTIQNAGTSRVTLSSQHEAIVANSEGSLRIDAVGNALESFDASASKGAVRANLTSRAGELDVVLGAGADRIDVSNATFVQARSSFDGGEGSDTLMLNAAFDNTGAAGAGTQRSSLERATGFEVFGVTGAGNTAAINLANTAIAQFRFENTGNVTLTQVENTDSFTTAEGAGAIGVVDATMKTGQNTLNLSMMSAGSQGSNIGVLNTTGVQIVNLASNVTGVGQPANTIGSVNNGVATNFTVNVTGAQDLTIGGFAAVATVNASAATGDLDITGSTGADIITTGSGDDVLRGGQGADTLRGGEGDDVFAVAFGGGGTAAVAAIASVTDIDVLNATDVSSIAIGIDQDGDGVVAATEVITVTTPGLSAAVNTRQLATELQAQLRTALGDTDVSVAATDAFTITVTDAAGRSIDEASVVVLDDAAVVAPGPDVGAGLTQVTAGVPATAAAVASSTTIQFASTADVLDVGTLDINVAGSVVNTIVTPGSNINQIAAATALAINTALRGTSVTATVVSPTSFTITDSDGNDIDETTLAVGDGAAQASPIAAAAIEVAAGSLATTQTPTVEALAVTNVTNVSSVTLSVGGVAQTVLLPDTAWANDAAFAVALQSALQTAFDANITVADEAGGATVNSVEITDALGRTITLVNVFDEGTPGAQVAAVVTEVAAGSEAIAAVGGVASESTAAALDTIADFTVGSDLISLLDFTGAAAATPTGAYFAGTVTAGSLGAALTLAISDANGSLSGTPALANGNAVMFVYGGNTYAYVDNADVGGTFNSADANNVLVKITGALDLTQGAVVPTTIFA